MILAGLLALPMFLWGAATIRTRRSSPTTKGRGPAHPYSRSALSGFSGKQTGRAPQVPSDPHSRALADQAIREKLWGGQKQEDSPDSTVAAGGPTPEASGDVSDAKTRRIELSNKRELVRAALRSTGAHGYYVFDELVTEHAGTMDYLAVGPLEAAVIVVRQNPGVVSADRDGELLIDGRRFADDPREQARELSQDISSRVFGAEDRVEYFICFTEARLMVDKDNQYPRSTTPLMDLAWALDPEGEQNLTPADIEEIAEKVEDAYGRPPFVRPATGGQV